MPSHGDPQLLPSPGTRPGAAAPRGLPPPGLPPGASTERQPPPNSVLADSGWRIKAGDTSHQSGRGWVEGQGYTFGLDQPVREAIAVGSPVSVLSSAAPLSAPGSAREPRFLPTPCLEVTVPSLLPARGRGGGAPVACFNPSDGAGRAFPPDGLLLLLGAGAGPGPVGDPGGPGERPEPLCPASCWLPAAPTAQGHAAQVCAARRGCGGQPGPPCDGPCPP